MTPHIYLVRHAKAGDRLRFSGNDETRPLTRRGLDQAAGLIGQLWDAGIERIVSSRYTRCTQTVDPLAERLGLEVAIDDALAEGASLSQTYELIRRSADRPTALCSHGDVIGNLIGCLTETGTPGAERLLWKKGSTWVLTLSDGNVTRAEYLDPPA